jgi:hypothetical protein
MSIAIEPKPQRRDGAEAMSVVPTMAILGEGPVWLPTGKIETSFGLTGVLPGVDLNFADHAFVTPSVCGQLPSLPLTCGP